MLPLKSCNTRHMSFAVLLALGSPSNFKPCKNHDEEMISSFLFLEKGSYRSLCFSYLMIYLEKHHLPSGLLSHGLELFVATSFKRKS